MVYRGRPRPLPMPQVLYHKDAVGKDCSYSGILSISVRDAHNQFGGRSTRCSGPANLSVTQPTSSRPLCPHGGGPNARAPSTCRDIYPTHDAACKTNIITICTSTSHNAPCNSEGAACPDRTTFADGCQCANDESNDATKADTAPYSSEGAHYSIGTEGATNCCTSEGAPCPTCHRTHTRQYTTPCNTPPFSQHPDNAHDDPRRCRRAIPHLLLRTGPSINRAR